MPYALPENPFCCFCECISERLPYFPLLETGNAVVFLNPRQRSEGSLLVAPRRHVSTLVELTEKEMSDVLLLTRRTGEILLTKLQPDGLHTWCNCGVAAGQSEAHVHFQVVPRYKDVPYTFASSNELPFTLAHTLSALANKLTGS
jgi:histidine triad (HIT) family protein